MFQHTRHADECPVTVTSLTAIAITLVTTVSVPMAAMYLVVNPELGGLGLALGVGYVFLHRAADTITREKRDAADTSAGRPNWFGALVDAGTATRRSDPE